MVFSRSNVRSLTTIPNSSLRPCLGKESIVLVVQTIDGEKWQYKIAKAWRARVRKGPPLPSPLLQSMCLAAWESTRLTKSRQLLECGCPLPLWVFRGVRNTERVAPAKAAED